MTRYITFLVVFYILHITVSGRAGSSDASGGGGIKLSGSFGGSNNGFSFGSNGNIGGGSKGSGGGGGGSEGSGGGGAGSEGSWSLGGGSKGSGSGGGGSQGSGGGGKGSGGGGAKGSLSGSFSLGSMLENLVDGASDKFSSLGLNVEDSIKRLLSAIPGGSIEFSNNGSIGGSGGGSISSDINIKSLVTGIIESPYKIIRSVIRHIVNFVWDILTLQFKVLKIPYSVISRVVSIIKMIVVAVVSRIMNVILKVQMINAEAVSKVIGVAESFVGFIVSTLASVQISGIKAAFGVLGFGRERVVELLSLIFKTVSNIITTLLKVLTGGVKVLRLDKIPQLPVIRNIVGIVASGYNVGLSVIFKQVAQLSHFIDKIIYDHQDFFIPIFHRVLNIVLAIRDALSRILDNGEHSGIKAMIGNLKIVLAPLKEGGWQWTGLDGQTYHGSLTLNAICKKFGATVLPGSVYSDEGGCSGGPTEEAEDGVDGETSSSNEIQTESRSV